MLKSGDSNPLVGYHGKGILNDSSCLSHFRRPVADSPDSAGAQDVGSLTDSAEPPLVYSARLLCHCFLLNGEGLRPDRDVRVSIKSLALACLSHIVRWYPQCLARTLFIGETGK